MSLEMFDLRVHGFPISSITIAIYSPDISDKKVMYFYSFFFSRIRVIARSRCRLFCIEMKKKEGKKENKC